MASLYITIYAKWAIQNCTEYFTLPLAFSVQIGTMQTSEQWSFEIGGEMEGTGYDEISHAGLEQIGGTYEPKTLTLYQELAEIGAALKFNESERKLTLAHQKEAWSDPDATEARKDAIKVRLAVIAKDIDDLERQLFQVVDKIKNDRYAPIAA